MGLEEGSNRAMKIPRPQQNFRRCAEGKAGRQAPHATEDSTCGVGGLIRSATSALPSGYNLGGARISALKLGLFKCLTCTACVEGKPGQGRQAACRATTDVGRHPAVV